MSERVTATTKIKDAVRPHVPDKLWKRASRVYRLATGRDALSFPALKTQVVAGVIANFKVTNREDEIRVQWLVGEREFLEEVILPLIKPGENYMDIGAAIGTHSIYPAIKTPICNVWSAEPDRDSYNKLVENIALNGLTNVKSLNVALGDTDGEIQLMTSGSGGPAPRVAGIKSDHLNQNAFDEVVSVPCRRLATMVESGQIPAPDVVKIDVEGFELAVLRGFGDIRPMHILIEIHQAMGVSYADACSLLMSMGYHECKEHRIDRGNELLCHFAL